MSVSLEIRDVACEILEHDFVPLEGTPTLGECRYCERIEALSIPTTERCPECGIGWVDPESVETICGGCRRAA